jgi:AcrR family transcriptional regulator
MARPRNADGQRTRKAILDAALDLFAEKGFFGASLRDVARAVGVRESAIYNYFPSKEALFEALIAADQDTRLERLSSLLDEPAADLRERLERLARSCLEDFATPGQQQLFRILMSDGIRLARAGRLNLVDRLGAGRARLREVMRHFIDRGVLRDADPEMLAVSFSAPLVLWRQLHAIDADVPIVRDPGTFARQHVEQFMRGAAARRERQKTTTTRAAGRRRSARSERRVSPRPRV